MNELVLALFFKEKMKTMKIRDFQAFIFRYAQNEKIKKESKP